MVQNIRVAQEAYHSETQQYADISTGIPNGSTASTLDFYPASPVYQTVTAWGAACAACTKAAVWNNLPLHVDGPVLFGYTTIAGQAGTQGDLPNSVTVNGTVVALGVPATDWFAIGAEADLDGVTSTVTDVFGFSISNQIYVSNEGQ
jgi:hypothetical protein